MSIEQLIKQFEEVIDENQRLKTELEQIKQKEQRELKDHAEQQKLKTFQLEFPNKAESYTNEQLEGFIKKYGKELGSNVFRYVWTCRLDLRKYIYDVARMNPEIILWCGALHHTFYDENISENLLYLCAINDEIMKHITLEEFKQVLKNFNKPELIEMIVFEAIKQKRLLRTVSFYADIGLINAKQIYGLIKVGLRFHLSDKCFTPELAMEIVNKGLDPEDI